MTRHDLYPHRTAAANDREQNIQRAKTMLQDPLTEQIKGMRASLEKLLVRLEATDHTGFLGRQKLDKWERKLEFAHRVGIRAPVRKPVVILSKPKPVQVELVLPKKPPTSKE